MKAVVSCSALQQNVLFGFAGVQLAEPPRMRQEGKGWEAGRQRRFSSFAREGANCLLLMG